jgi:hypothetical protein
VLVSAGHRSTLTRSTGFNTIRVVDRDRCSQARWHAYCSLHSAYDDPVIHQIAGDSYRYVRLLASQRTGWCTRPAASRNMDSSSCSSILASRLLGSTNPLVQLPSRRCRTLQTLSEYDALAMKPISGCIVYVGTIVLKGCLGFIVCAIASRNPVAVSGRSI